MTNQQRVAMVTGSARGIGAATAKRFAQDGVHVALVDLDGAQCQATVDEILASGGSAVAFSCDVSNAEQVAKTVSEIVEKFGRIDILVNNAGIIRDNLLHKMTEQDWDLVMNVHLKGHFLCSREVQKYMVGQKSGKIVNVSSTSALGNRGQANYSAAKAGIQGFTRTLAIELGAFNINVNAVAPGFIDTDMTRATAARMGLDSEAFKQMASEHIPLRRIGKPEDVANVIAFLASEEASYVSGQILYVDGGRP